MPFPFRRFPLRSRHRLARSAPGDFLIVGRYADSATWEKLHKLGLKTNSTEEKQYFYEALASTIEPRLIERTLPLALTDELPTSRAAALLTLSARHGEHPELVWEYAQEHMKALLAKQDALGVNVFARGPLHLFLKPERRPDARALRENKSAAILRPVGRESSR